CPRESTQREGHPGRGAAPFIISFEGAVPCAPHRPRARAELAGAHKDNSARSGSNIVSRSPSGSAAVLGLLYGEGRAATTLFRSVRCSSRCRSQRMYRFEVVVLVGSP